MYYKECFHEGTWWFQSTPNGIWYKFTPEQVLA